MSLLKCSSWFAMIGLAGLLFAMPASPAPKAAANTAAARIDEIRQAFNSAYNAGDAAAIGDLVAENAVWMPPGQPAVVGRSAIEQRYAAQFSTTHSFFVLNPGEIRVVANLAWLRGSYQRVDTPIAGGPPTMTTGKYLMTFSRITGDWKIVNDCWNADETPLQVDARIALHGIRSLAEWRLRDVGDMLRLIVNTEQVKSGVWENMSGVLQSLEATDIPANAIWFVNPDGSYYTVEGGYTGLDLSDRSYFPGLMSGHRVLGTLVISRSTGKRSVIVAEPVRVGDQVIGGVGISYSVDQLSLEIDRTLQLPGAAVFYALDMNGQTALHRDPALMLEYPSDMGSDSLTSAVARMLSEPSGTVEYIFRETRKTVLFERSPVLGWVFALGSSEPMEKEIR
jgi:ketosteroid isomerase-like protein